MLNSPSSQSVLIGEVLQPSDHQEINEKLISLIRNVFVTRHLHFYKATPEHDLCITVSLLGGRNTLARVHNQPLKSISHGEEMPSDTTLGLARDEFMRLQLPLSSARDG